jgi:primary-amine oxidase
MAVERAKQIIQQVANVATSHTHHPLDPLTESEIATAVDLVRKERSDVIFNSVNLLEPKKADLKNWLASPRTDLHRYADVIASGPGSKVYDVVIDLTEKRISRWDEPTGVYPSITMEDLAVVEGIIRKDPEVIEQCGIVGIPPEDMHKVYCDPWTIGYSLLT